MRRRERDLLQDLFLSLGDRDGGGRAAGKLQQMIEEMKVQIVVPVIRMRAQPPEEENRMCKILARALAERLK